MTETEQISGYQLLTPAGGKVVVKYVARDTFFPELGHRIDHFEFRGDFGPTGYHSDFKFVELDYDPTDDEVVEFIMGKIEEMTNTKYGEPTQMGLI